MQQNIGFIGLGIMGQPMAANILRGGYPLAVYNRTAGKADALAAAGADVATSPAELAEACDTIILMLTGPEACEAVLGGENGILSADVAGKTLINMSTVPADYSQQLAADLRKQGMHCIDAPVSGSKIPAEQGTLVILAGGESSEIDRAEPLLLTMGSRVVRCGEAGNGSAMKLAINLLLGTMMTGLAESLALAERSGSATEDFLEAVGAGALSCPLFKIKEGMLKSGEYPPQFPFRHMAKDLQFVLDQAGKVASPIPLGKIVAGLFDPHASDDLLDADFAAVKRIIDSN